MNEGGTHSALGERALGRFELELEAERVDSGGSARELAGCLLGERAARQQAPIRCLGRVGSARLMRASPILMRNMNRILEIRNYTVTAQAGALYIDVNQELQKRNLQLFVNVELGNLTIGSAATGGIQDASIPVSSVTLRHTRSPSRQLPRMELCSN